MSIPLNELVSVLRHMGNFENYFLVCPQTKVQKRIADLRTYFEDSEYQLISKGNNNYYHYMSITSRPEFVGLHIDFDIVTKINHDVVNDNLLCYEMITNLQEYYDLSKKHYVNSFDIVSFNGKEYTVLEISDSIQEQKEIGIFGFEFLSDLRIHRSWEFGYYFTDRFADEIYKASDLISYVMNNSNIVQSSKKPRISFKEILDGKCMDITFDETVSLCNALDPDDVRNLTVQEKTNLTKFIMNMSSLASSTYVIRAVTKLGLLISYADVPEFKDLVTKHQLYVRCARTL